ncbi:putative gnat family acetyltransferase protein [Botrytis fragariae]|uniref:Putative gnat family acetyltransferase protein n=1 Tax=Botrytis fragariae TaxID=1964551 RepID=A0A8H6B3R3_9HELO|nr:putative gnat family acetyltransferase protein [Botrytis fragariae]KAF5878644.1 putative gnat family acetyltransferase protein [Botrytis fragariae]
MPPFTLTGAHTRPKFHTIALLIQKANRTPYRPFVAIQTPSAPDLPTALTLSQDCHWITVQDSETKEVVGAANWLAEDELDEEGVFLNILATHPSYRRQGVASLLMQFGEEKAKEFNLECWSEAGREGARFLLEKHGWRPLLKYCIYGTKENMSEEWQELCHKCLPQEQYAMWKPKGGVWTDDTVFPWDLGVEN